MDKAPWQHVLQTGELILATPGSLQTPTRRINGRVNCSPISDTAGRVRGCLVTFADLTAIEERNAELRIALAELNQSRDQIEKQNRELVKLANYDGLTELLNRRSFFSTAEAAISRCARAGHGFAVLMLDVDHFKSFNDRYGHAVGDSVLKRVAACLRETVRPHDHVGRYGGEEFSVMVEDITADDVHALAERIRLNIEAHAGKGIDDGRDLQVTISIGVAVTQAVYTPLSLMLQRADQCLYEAKRTGRNRIVMVRHEPNTDKAAPPVVAAAAE
jgi:diguanylate cyclase (GGDEF)-like protein